MSKENYTFSLSDNEWKQRLTSEQYNVLRKKGTERPFTGEYDTFFDDGNYVCAGCGELLFNSNSKYNSGCGWPAFDAPATKENIVEITDKSHGMTRVEVLCANCGGHLGHVFNDGPKATTGIRYCINSASLEFKDEL
ncbi:MAG: peptide-methionine (R)-S-oxide reductase MsrB [Bacteroidetes bacterium]|nr:peptide-methionine (R)-S-oxide reductase MsrB [Bacteroidota bacterium]MBP7398074.1 peptide-methionine (R)-S-oxide reductase MsrB [Chitinophagales bacterium]MBK7109325.1 peptide-methionine (R)-S-oxide reductase MsrB [Bacteroidota bacterium]MBK8487931.1 peptide-methionine (R)-S-oxide reductase MsrB [Bacteroidota bacterium]MBK8682314.1 peptide-methionine (R)-S-oxide reductase MsrB [Bacteroidota bacterium]